MSIGSTYLHREHLPNVSSHLPLNALRVFEAAARHLSFRQAAEELNVTPAAVSQQIKSLEDLLDAKLFHRLHRGLALTEAGEAGLTPLQDGFARLQEGVRLLRGAEDRSGLNVWMAPSFASRWLLPRLDSFIEAHPHIELWINASADLIDSESSRLNFNEELMLAEGIDVGIRFGSGRYPGCRVDKLMPAEVVPVCSPQLLKRTNKPLTKPEDLAHHVLLHDDTPYEGRPGWDDWFEAAGVTGVDTQRGVHFNSLQLALAAASDGQGVALGIRQLAEDDIEAGLLVMPFKEMVETDRSYYIISREETADNPAVVAFREWALDRVA